MRRKVAGWLFEDSPDWLWSLLPERVWYWVLDQVYGQRFPRP